MIKNEYYFKSADKKTDIHVKEWIPEGKVEAILQICHGMVEHIGRYDTFASSFADKGILVVANDHLGHGLSVSEKEKYGYFADENGYMKVVEDMNTLRMKTQEQYPDIPYFILGHSMGSFLTRYYITKYGKGLSGAIIMGTGHMAPVITKTGMKLCTMIAKSKGWYYRSNFIDNMGVGGYNKKFGEKGGNEWLSRNTENCEKYKEDPLCGFVFTLNGYYNLFSCFNYVSKDKNIEKAPKDLPILFVSGDDDPVGSYGKGVTTVYEKFKKLKFKEVDMKLYKDDRHEILSELDRDKVYNDIYNWICEGKI